MKTRNNSKLNADTVTLEIDCQKVLSGIDLVQMDYVDPVTNISYNASMRAFQSPENPSCFRLLCWTPGIVNRRARFLSLDILLPIFKYRKYTVTFNYRNCTEARALKAVDVNVGKIDINFIKSNPEDWIELNSKYVKIQIWPDKRLAKRSLKKLQRSKMISKPIWDWETENWKVNCMTCNPLFPVSSNSEEFGRVGLPEVYKDKGKIIKYKQSTFIRIPSEAQKVLTFYDKSVYDQMIQKHLPTNINYLNEFQYNALIESKSLEDFKIEYDLDYTNEGKKPSFEDIWKINGKDPRISVRYRNIKTQLCSKNALSNKDYEKVVTLDFLQFDTKYPIFEELWFKYTPTQEDLDKGADVKGGVWHLNKTKLKDSDTTLWESHIYSKDWKPEEDKYLPINWDQQNDWEELAKLGCATKLVTLGERKTFAESTIECPICKQLKILTKACDWGSKGL